MKINAKFIMIGFISIAIGIIFWGFHSISRTNQTARHSIKTTRKARNKGKSRTTLATTSRQKPSKVTKVDWRGPSMPDRAYPQIQQHPDLKIEVSTEKQRVFLKEHGETLYTMLASTGRPGDETPKGQFQIEPERGTHFYNASVSTGANYWVSFKDHGGFLFHSVPVDGSGNYMTSQAEQLGKKPLSHGCVRLSVSDSKWLYENIQQSTPVEVS